MPNEEMKVFATLSNKGGAGKTMLLKIFGSAAMANELRVLFIDTDGNRSLSAWAGRATEAGNWPKNGRMEFTDSVEEVEALIDDAYDNDTADLVMIDTAGYGTDELDKVALLADYIVTPIKISTTDFEATKIAQRWYQGLAERVKGDGNLPEHIVVLNDVPKDFNKIEKALLPEIRTTFDTTPTPMPRRAAFASMDHHGPLMTLVGNMEESEFAGIRLQAQHVFKALEVGTTVLNEILTGKRHAS